MDYYLINKKIGGYYEETILGIASTGCRLHDCRL